MKTRMSVSNFAELMEKKLQDNDHKDGWRNCHVFWLLTKLGEETGELHKIFADSFYSDDLASIGSVDLDAIQSECADIANIAMMISEVAEDIADILT